MIDNDTMIDNAGDDRSARTSDPTVSRVTNGDDVTDANHHQSVQPGFKATAKQNGSHQASQEPGSYTVPENVQPGYGLEWLTVVEQRHGGSARRTITGVMDGWWHNK